MSVYLGQDKVGISYMTSANMYEDNKSIMSNDVYTPWTRPQEWPDLDSLNLEMSGLNSFIYMTYRTGHIEDVCAFSLSTVSGNAEISIGTITNGIFTANSTETVSSGTTKKYWFTSNEGYLNGTIVVKITGRLSRFYLIDVTRDSSDGGGTLRWFMQPMLERIWYVPDLISFNNGSTSTTTGNGTYTIERDKIANGEGTALISLYAAWANCYRLLSLDISNLYTPNITHMAAAFEYCRLLEHINISHLNTAKVTNMAYLFDGCYRLKELDLSTWNTHSLTGTGIYYMFRNCYALKEIKGLEYFYTNNLTNFLSLFSGCYSLKDLSGITYWNISKVISLNSTFYCCYRIATLNLSHWDVTKVTNISAMFYSCRNLRHINFPTGPTATLVGAQNAIFYCCMNLQEVDLSWLGPVTNAVTSIGSMFYQCRSLSEINIPEGWDITGCVVSESCYRIFSDCYKVLRITGISNWDMSNYNYTLAYSFENCYCLKEIDIKNWCPHPTSIYYGFIACRSLESIDLTGWHWENITGNGMASIFDSCLSLKEIKGIEHLGDSGNATSFASIFSGCYSLTAIPNISSWNPAKVTSIGYMFNECRSLLNLIISNWSLPKCTNISYMFRYCYSLRELELTNWSLPALTSADYVFSLMPSLIKFSGLPLNIAFKILEAYSLPEDLWARLFNLLSTVSNLKINMTTAVINRLTAGTKKIATDKGWQLVN